MKSRITWKIQSHAAAHIFPEQPTKPRELERGISRPRAERAPSGGFSKLFLVPHIHRYTPTAEPSRAADAGPCEVYVYRCALCGRRRVLLPSGPVRACTSKTRLFLSSRSLCVQNGGGCAAAADDDEHRRRALTSPGTPLRLQLPYLTSQQPRVESSREIQATVHNTYTHPYARSPSRGTRTTEQKERRRTDPRGGLGIEPSDAPDADDDDALSRVRSTSAAERASSAARSSLYRKCLSVCALYLLRRTHHPG